MKALLCAGADLNTLASQDGQAKPIWSANPGAVKTLLGQFPAHLNLKELRAGGTPAHWATEKPLLEVRIHHSHGSKNSISRPSIPKFVIPGSLGPRVLCGGT